jgi:general secretion pathway protein M
MKAQLGEITKKMEESLEPLLLRYQSFSPSEQLIINGLGVLIVIVLVFVLIWMPVYQWKNEKQALYQRQQELVAWINTKAPLVAGRGAREGQLPRGQTLQSVIARDAQRVKIQLQRTEPRGQNLRVWVNEVPFDNLMTWLLALEKRFGIATEDVSIEHKPAQEGSVKATIEFTAG